MIFVFVRWDLNTSNAYDLINFVVFQIINEIGSGFTPHAYTHLQKKECNLDHNITIDLL